MYNGMYSSKLGRRGGMRSRGVWICRQPIAGSAELAVPSAHLQELPLRLVVGRELSWLRVPDIPGTAQPCLLLGC